MNDIQGTGHITCCRHASCSHSGAAEVLHPVKVLGCTPLRAFNEHARDPDTDWRTSTQHEMLGADGAPRFPSNKEVGYRT